MAIWRFDTSRILTSPVSGSITVLSGFLIDHRFMPYIVRPAVNRFLVSGASLLHTAIRSAGLDLPVNVVRLQTLRANGHKQLVGSDARSTASCQ
jgi:hypothetical protein